MTEKKSLKILGIIGDPISHSLSPLMHNAALAHLKLPYLYLPFHIKANELKSFFKSLPSKNIVGLNVTIPHKEAVIPFMDSLSPTAKKVGAVNTILVNKHGKLVGHNTDGEGYLLALKNEAHLTVTGKKIILLGAGGAARGLLTTLAQNGAKEIIVINRTLERAVELICKIAPRFPNTNFKISELTKIPNEIWSKTNLLINSTSLGMKNKKLPRLALYRLPKNAAISDIVYMPLKTPLLKKAKTLGLKTIPGWGMLLYQGALAFELWTGQKAPIDIMKDALLENLA